MKVTLKPEKTTKNTVRFTETCNDPNEPVVIGSVYIPKSTLQTMGWDGKEQIQITLEVQK